MKKIFAMMCTAAVMFAACTPEDAVVIPSVSFESAVPVAADGTATFKIVTADYSAAEAVTIPVNFGGTAVLNTDYSVSAQAFVVGGDSPVTEIVVTALNYGTGKDVSLTLDLPQGWKGGQYTTSTFTLFDKLGWVSFSNKKAGMTNKVTLTVGMFDSEGKSLNLEKGDVIPVKVNTEQSTAVEGVNFSFAGDKAVTIEAGQNKGTITLNLIGDVAVADADVLVLELDPGAKYELGANNKVTVTILGSEWNRLNGEWKINKLYTDAEYMENFWGGWASFTNFDLIPQYEIKDENGEVLETINTEDKLVFDMESLTMTPSFESTFKDYFIGTSNITPAEDMKLYLNGSNGAYYDPGFFMPITVSTMWLDNTNRYFCATEQSEDKVSLLAYGIGKDAEENDLLYIYVIDYTTKGFMPELFYFYFYPGDEKYAEYADYEYYFNADKPTASMMSDTYMIASFKKVN